jgi:hypothetical protein
LSCPLVHFWSSLVPLMALLVSYCVFPLFVFSLPDFEGQ